MIIFTKCSWGLVTLIGGFIALWANALAVDSSCDGEWVQLGPGLHYSQRCVAERGAEKKLAVIAIDLATRKLSLTGTGPNGRVPQLSDVSATDVPVDEFSLQRLVKGNADIEIAISAGYPRSALSFLTDGFVRIDGVDVSERDLTAKFKSAMFCIDELAAGKSSGSVPVVFNAFEDGGPIELNPRVLDNKSCRDVIQVGPRIIEYRGKKGIGPEASSRKPQRYISFSVGAGPAYRGYVVVSIEDITLFALQNFLLTADNWSEFDKKQDKSTVVAVTIAAGKESGMIIKTGKELEGGRSGEGVQYFGNGEDPVGTAIIVETVH